jgi:hypothetical protein
MTGHEPQTGHEEFVRVTIAYLRLTSVIFTSSHALQNGARVASDVYIRLAEGDQEVKCIIKKLDCVYKRLLHLYLPTFLHIFPLLPCLIKSARSTELPFLLVRLSLRCLTDKNTHKLYATATENRCEEFGMVEILCRCNMPTGKDKKKKEKEG